MSLRKCLGLGAKVKLVYLFSFYSSLIAETELHVDKQREDWSDSKYFNSNSTVPIPNKDGHLTDVDAQIEFIAEFLKVNMMFYKFKSGTDSIQVIPLGETQENLQNDFKTLFEKDINSMLESFNAWKNGIELIDLINLFDWTINKKAQGSELNYIVTPHSSAMKEYLNKEFGLHIYVNLKHTATYMKHISIIANFVDNKNIKDIINQEYMYIQDTFENEYYIDSKIFNMKHNHYALSSYVKFYLMFRVYFFYILNPQDRVPIFIVDWEFIVKLFISNVSLFEETIDIHNQKKMEDFLNKCLEFYTNNGDDLFNFPLFKYDFLQYAIPNTIISANLPRIFVERFLKIVPNKILTDKGPMLENNLLSNSRNLQNRGIKILKNIELKIKKQVFGEIDILLFDGTNILIAELKNQSLFNCRKEMYNRKQYLKKTAAKQINRAKDYLLKNKKLMSRQLGINLDEVDEIIPIVVTSLDELHNMTLGNTLVVSSFFLKMYFEHDHFAVREFSLTQNTVIQKRHFNEPVVKITEFIEFIKSNRSIKMLNYFNDKKITTATVFNHSNISFSRTLMAQKETTNKALQQTATQLLK